MMWLRTSTGKIHASYSRDAGATWSDPVPLSVTAPVAPASIKRIPATGDLLLVWNHSPSERVPLTTAVSSDEGQTWQHVRNLEDDARYTYAYTSINFVGDRALFTYYTNVGKAGRELVLEIQERAAGLALRAVRRAHRPRRGGGAVCPPDKPWRLEADRNSHRRAGQRSCGCGGR